MYGYVDFLIDQILPTEVTTGDRKNYPLAPARSGQYGFYRPEPIRSGAESEADPRRPIVQVAQLIIKRGKDVSALSWSPTPARYYAQQIALLLPDSRLSIDFGQGWSLSKADTDDFRSYALAVLGSDYVWPPCGCGDLDGAHHWSCSIYK